MFFFHLNEEFLINKHSLSPLMQLYFNLRATDQKKPTSIYFASIFFPQEGLFSFSWILLYASFMNHCKEMKNWSCYIHPFNTCTGTFLGAFQDIVFTHIDKVPFLISLKSNHNSTLIKLTAFFFFYIFCTRMFWSNHGRKLKTQLNSWKLVLSGTRVIKDYTDTCKFPYVKL